MIHRNIFIGILLVVIAVTGSVAQMTQERHTLLTYSLKQSDSILAAGRLGTIAITMDIADGWWSYGMKHIMDSNGIGPQPTGIRLLASDVVSQAGDVQATKPKTKQDIHFRIAVDYYEHTAKFTVPFRVGKNVQPGRYRAAIQVYAMVCDSNRCFPPRADTLYYTVIVKQASKSGKRKKGDAKGDNGSYGKSDPANMIQNDSSIPNRAENGKAGAVECCILFDTRKKLM